MTRTKTNLLLVIAGLIGETAIFFALEAVGASHQMVILAVLVWMMLVCYMVGVFGVHFERKEEEQER